MATTGVGSGTASVVAVGAASIVSAFVTGLAASSSAGAVAPNDSRRAAASTVHASGGSAGVAGSWPVSEWTSEPTNSDMPVAADSTESGVACSGGSATGAFATGVIASAADTVAFAADSVALGFGAGSVPADCVVVLDGEGSSCWAVTRDFAWPSFGVASADGLSTCSVAGDADFERLRLGLVVASSVVPAPTSDAASAESGSDFGTVVASSLADAS